MTTKRVNFKNASKAMLAGLLDLPQENPKAFVLVAHCFTCGKNLKSIANIAKRLSKHGFGVLRFDFTGIGESEGDFTDTNFSTNVDDLCAAANYLGQDFRRPEVLIGHSLGGAAVLAAAHRIAGTKAVATIATASSTTRLINTLTRELPDLKNQPEAVLVLAGKRFVIKKQLLDDLHTHSIETYIADLGLPLMVFHSPIDQTVPIDNAREIYEAAKHPKSFVSLDRADHLLLNPDDARMVADILAGWANRYL